MRWPGSTHTQHRNALKVGCQCCSSAPGENCERTWAELAHQGLVTKYMSGPNRECRIERAAHLLNRAQDWQTSSLLTQMTARAEAELVACKEEIAEEVTSLQDLLSEQGDGHEDVSASVSGS